MSGSAIAMRTMDLSVLSDWRSPESNHLKKPLFSVALIFVIIAGTHSGESIIARRCCSALWTFGMR
jgi:hypothetical protein